MGRADIAPAHAAQHSVEHVDLSHLLLAAHAAGHRMPPVTGEKVCMPCMPPKPAPPAICAEAVADEPQQGNWQRRLRQ